MTIVSTKYHSPDYSPGKYISRKISKDLIPQSKQIVLVTGPAGYGKTTLIAEWINKSEADYIYISLDYFDDHLSRFWNTIIGGLQKRFTTVGATAIAMLASEKRPAIEACLISLINDLGSITSGYIIILDDLHEIEDQEIYNSLDFFIDNLPQSFQIVLSGREDPPLALGRLRTSDKLKEIRQADLRLTRDEFQKQLHKSICINITPEVLDILYKKTEGWVAGLQLAVLAINKQDDPMQFIKDFSGTHSFLIDYLLDEVLSGLDSETEKFLLDTSIFLDFNHRLCDSYLNIENSLELIEKLKKSNLFLISLDNQNLWYRYHQLFRDFLKNRLISKLTLKEQKTRYLQAFNVLKLYNQDEKAFVMGILSEDYDACKDFLMAYIPQLMAEGRYSDIQRSIKSFPDFFILHDPDLYAFRVWMKAINFEQESFQFEGAMTPFLEGVLSMSSGYFSYVRKGNLSESIQLLVKGLSLIPPEFSEIINTGKFITGSAYLQAGDLYKAEDYFSIDLKEDRFKRRYFSAVLQEIKLITLFLEKGNLRQAQTILDETFNKVASIRENINLGITGFLWVLKAWIELQENRLDKALQYINKGFPLSKETDSEGLTIISMMIKGEIEFASNQIIQSQNTFNSITLRTNKTSPWLSYTARAWLARIEIKKKSPPELWAKDFIKRHDSYRNLKKIQSWEFQEYLIYAEYLQFKKRFKDADFLLNIMSNGCLEHGRIQHLCIVLIRRAVIKYIQKDLIEAASILKRVFELNQDENHIHIFIDAGKDCLHLLADADKKNQLPDYLKPIAQEDPEIIRKVSIKIYESTETFNDREIAILRLLDKGYSNQQIGESIYLSTNTVRWYASQIYSKLDVKRRGEAVMRAHELGIL